MGITDIFTNRKKRTEKINEKIDYYVDNTIIKALADKGTKQIKTTDFTNNSKKDSRHQAFSLYDVDKTYNNIKDLITDYRRISNFSYVANAIDEITNTAVVLNGEDTIRLKFKEYNQKEQIPKNIQDILIEEFENIKELLNFDEEGDTLFRNWYVDGRLYLQKILNEKKPKDGIIQIKQISPLSMRYEYDEKNKKHYYIYCPENYKQQRINLGIIEELKIPTELITYNHSGLIHSDLGVPQSYLHYVLRSANRLDMLENHLLVYRIARSPERYAFYVDIGNMPYEQGKKYLNQVMNEYKNKLTYDSSNGKIKDNADTFSMLENFYLMSRNGDGTKIESISGGDGLGQLEDLNHFKTQVYESLKVPMGRINHENMGTLDFSRQSEIERDELKFSKFIDKLRMRFSHIFYDLLSYQCHLKGKIKRNEFVKYKKYMYFDYMSDNWWKEQRDIDKFKQKLDLLRDADEYVGKWFSRKEVHQKIFRRTDNDITELDKQNKKEKEEYGNEEEDSGGRRF